MYNYMLAELIKKYRNNDEVAFYEIYKEFEKSILKYAAKTGGEDARQDLILFFIELLNTINLDKFKDKFSDGLSRYIAVSLKNQYIFISKNKNKDIQQISFEETENFLGFVYDDYFGISEALSKLSEKQRFIITYKYIYNYSDTEISDILGITRQAVNRLKNRALKTLLEYYTDTI